MHTLPRISSAAIVAATALLGGCGGKQGDVGVTRAPTRIATYQSEVHEEIGAAIMILLDTSGSMSDPAPGGGLTKFEAAQKAVLEMLGATEAFVTKKPDFAIKVGLLRFSSRARVVRPIGEYDRDALALAARSMPAPAGGTAIGDAMHLARKELYRSGVFRKYMIVVTDGENTRGADPHRVVREIDRRSERSVSFYFVAFDTAPETFSFLREVGGEVVPAQDPRELESALKDIYEGKILAEAADYGEPSSAAPQPRDGR